MDLGAQIKYQTTKFESLLELFKKYAHTLGSVKSSIPHGDWRFHFFSNFI
jgi:hypothetical protein